MINSYWNYPLVSSNKYLAVFFQVSHYFHLAKSKSRFSAHTDENHLQCNRRVQSSTVLPRNRETSPSSITSGVTQTLLDRVHAVTIQNMSIHNVQAPIKCQRSKLSGLNLIVKYALNIRSCNKDRGVRITPHDSDGNRVSISSTWTVTAPWGQMRFSHKVLRELAEATAKPPSIICQ